jgi:hypothetical protein
MERAVRNELAARPAWPAPITTVVKRSMDPFSREWVTV